MTQLVQRDMADHQPLCHSFVCQPHRLSPRPHFNLITWIIVYFFSYFNTFRLHIDRQRWMDRCIYTLELLVKHDGK